MAIALQWESASPPYHVETVAMANRNNDFVSRALQRLSAVRGTPPPTAAVITPLATGGAMAVYKLTALWSQGHVQHAVCKIPWQRQLVYAAADRHTTIETTTQLLNRLASLANELAQKAPGLFPRSGGVWHQPAPHGCNGEARHLLMEEFIPGLSLERLRHDYEQLWMDGRLSTKAYHQRRLGLERLAIATFTRLWDVLGRHTFTSDPSPWNVLAAQQVTDSDISHGATIIDLHSLAEDVGLSYVIQRLAAVYGLRQDVLEQALLPGVLDTLGPDEGRTLLRAELPRLEMEAEEAARHLGVNLQQPLIKAIRAL